MKEQSPKKVSIFTILIFILCALLFVYMIMSAVNVTSYIKESIEFGQIAVNKNLYEIINYYMSNCGIYVIYISILLAIWWTRPWRNVTTVPDEKPVDIIEKAKEVDIIEKVKEIELIETDEKPTDSVDSISNKNDDVSMPYMSVSYVSNDDAEKGGDVEKDYKESKKL